MFIGIFSATVLCVFLRGVGIVGATPNTRYEDGSSGP